MQPSQTVDRALTVLELFTRNQPSWTLTGLAERLDIHRSIVFRLLQVLESHGFLTKDEKTKEYRLGFRLLELGHLVELQNELVRVAKPILRELVQMTGQSALLSVVDSDGWVVCVDGVESPRPIRYTMSPGTKTWLHAGATNKVMLAYLPQDQIDRFLSCELPRFTPATITDPDALRSQIVEIRRAGMATSKDELDLDVAAVAVPILDSAGVLLGGLSLAGPVNRCPPEGLADMGRILKMAVRRLTESLGMPPHSNAPYAKEGCCQ